MKRTTLAIQEDVLRELKRRAAERGTTVQAVANELLRQALARPRDAKKFKLRLPAGWQAKPLPGVDIGDRDNLFDLMNGR
jgi:plasmid stability protein